MLSPANDAPLTEVEINGIRRRVLVELVEELAEASAPVGHRILAMKRGTQEPARPLTEAEVDRIMDAMQAIEEAGSRAACV